MSLNVKMGENGHATILYFKMMKKLLKRHKHDTGWMVKMKKDKVLLMIAKHPSNSKIFFLSFYNMSTYTPYIAVNVKP